MLRDARNQKEMEDLANTVMICSGSSLEDVQDPAAGDVELENKLRRNKRLGDRKMEEVCEFPIHFLCKFVRAQFSTFND
jgi:hypothetical protein